MGEKTASFKRRLF